jgi:hypothetical protein
MRRYENSLPQSHPYFADVAGAKSPVIDTFKTIALVCGVGLLVSLLLAAGLASFQPKLEAPEVIDWI